METVCMAFASSIQSAKQSMHEYQSFMCTGELLLSKFRDFFQDLTMHQKKASGRPANSEMVKCCQYKACLLSTRQHVWHLMISANTRSNATAI